VAPRTCFTPVCRYGAKTALAAGTRLSRADFVMAAVATEQIVAAFVTRLLETVF